MTLVSFSIFKATEGELPDNAKVRIYLQSMVYGYSKHGMHVVSGPGSNKCRSGEYFECRRARSVRGGGSMIVSR